MKLAIAAICFALVFLAGGEVTKLPHPLDSSNTTISQAGISPNEAIDDWNPPPPAADDLWDKAVCRGGRLLTGMLGSDAEAGQYYSPARPSAQSEFRNFPQALADWDYFFNPLAFFGRNFDVTWGVANVLRALGVSDRALEEGGRIGVEYVTHGDPAARDEEGPIGIDEQTYQEPGGTRWLHATGAHFSMGINPIDGVLIIMEKQVARFAGQIHHVPDNELPRLQRSSDVEFGMWKAYQDEYNGGRYNNLRYYLVASITELGTRAIIRRTLDNAGAHSSPWPGQEFSMDTTEGKAILGSPLGSPLGYLLMEHKAELGNMYVSKVKVFHSSTSSQQPCYLFYVEQPRANAGGMDILLEANTTMELGDVNQVLRTHILGSKL